MDPELFVGIYISIWGPEAVAEGYMAYNSTVELWSEISGMDFRGFDHYPMGEALLRFLELHALLKLHRDAELVCNNVCSSCRFPA